MRTKLFSVIAGAALLAAAAAPVMAHHSFAAEFDAKKPVKMKGTVVKMEWINPHSWIHIDVKRDDGKVERWMVEGGAPNALLRRGWNKNSLPEGTEIVVEGFQAKDGSNRANGRDITFPDGKKLFVGSSGIGAPDEKPGNNRSNRPSSGVESNSQLPTTNSQASWELAVGSWEFFYADTLDSGSRLGCALAHRGHAHHRDDGGLLRIHPPRRLQQAAAGHDRDSRPEPGDAARRARDRRRLGADVDLHLVGQRPLRRVG